MFGFLLVACSLQVFAQSNPTSTYNLSAAAYTLTAWPTTSPAGSYPNSMIFHTHTGTTDPIITTNTTSDYTLAYNLALNARINGHLTNGIIFANVGTVTNYLGAAVLSLNTVSCTNINVDWVGRTQVTGTRNYSIRLQYRIGNVGAFVDVPGGPWEYLSNAVLNHSATVSCNLSTLTSNAVDNQAEVQIRWKYFYYGALTGTRPQLALDDINITRSVSLVNTIATGVVAGSPFCVTSTAGVSVSVPFSYGPGAAFISGSTVFTAELSNSAGVFSSPTAIGTIVSNASGTQTIAATLPAGTSTGNAYRIRVISDVPAVVGSANPANLTINLSPVDVTGETIAPANNQVGVSWVNPTSCFNEIMIVARAGGSVVGTPVGNGSAYTANPLFSLGTAFGGGFVVYKGAGTGSTTFGLANGTNYCFKIFVRYGTNWSPGVEICATPNNGTIFKRGDFAIVGVNANNSCSSSTEDEISFVCFQDIINNTSLDMTDNGWESVLLNKWGTAEGFVRATRSGGTILAGTVITFRFVGASYVAVAPDANWSFASLTPTNVSFPFPQLNLNSSGDQIYFMQGGVWNPGTNSASGDATYTGGLVLFGFNSTTAWVNLQNSTSHSGLYPGLECYSIAALTSQTNYFKYTGSLAIKTQRNWIDFINSAANWSTYSTCTLYNAGVPIYPSGVFLPVTPGGFRKGYWTGSKTDRWHLCDNWENFEVPDSTYDVFFPSTGTTNICNLQITDSAKCKDLNMLGSELNGAGSTAKKINILGNLSISGGELDFDDFNGGVLDGEIYLKGNWSNTNDAFFKEGNSKVYFQGTTLQTLNTPTKESFYQVSLNNALGLDISTKMEINNQLTFVNGKISTSSNEVHINSVGPSFISGHGLTRYVNGNLRRNIQPGGTYDFPVGTATQYELTTIQFNSASGLSSLLVDFKSPHSGTFPDSSICFINGTPINDMLNYGYWTVTPDNPLATVSYNITLNERGHTNSVTPASRYGVIKRVNSFIDWDGSQGIHNNATQSESGGTATAYRSSVAAFSDFAIGFNHTLAIPLPIILLSFDATRLNNDVITKWQISNTDDCLEMILERSNNGIDFYPLSNVSCEINTINYSFIDTKPLPGNNFYRLQMVDLEGKINYSNIEKVVFNKSYTTDFTVNVYMNANNDLQFVYDENELTLVNIFDSKGSLLYSQNIQLNKGDNILSNFNSDKFGKGVYLIRFYSDKRNVAAKFELK